MLSELLWNMYCFNFMRNYSNKTVLNDEKCIRTLCSVIVQRIAKKFVEENSNFDLDTGYRGKVYFPSFKGTWCSG